MKAEVSSESWPVHLVHLVHSCQHLVEIDAHGPHSVVNSEVVREAPVAA